MTNNCGFRRAISPDVGRSSIVLLGALGLFSVAACTGKIGDAGGSAGANVGAGATGDSGTPATGGHTGSASGGGSGGNVVMGSGGTGGATASGSGGISGNQPGSGGSAAGGGAGGVVTAAGAPALRRLTTRQFQNSLRALLGDVTVGIIEEDSHDGGLATIGATQIVTSPDGVEKYQLAIDAALDAVFADATKRSALLTGASCPPKLSANDACTNGFISRFGRLAWRRALTPVEVARYTALAATATQTLADANAGARWAASALLQSPNFLYRAELGQPVPGRADVRQLTNNEMASRLAFFLWESAPDDTLLVAAENGLLTSPSDLSAQAQRMIVSPAGHNAVTGFVRDFFWLDRLDSTAKDSTLFPGFTDTLRTTMGEELTRMWESVAFDQDGSALDLFTTRHTFVTKELATLYGIPTAGLTDTALTAVDLPATGARVGFLGTAALLAMNADQKEGSPTLRGKFIREELLCQAIPAPPANVDTTLKDPPAGVTYTKREKLEMHRSLPSCAACHSLMDPLGYPLEAFDAVGAFRTTDAGKTIDASGSLDGVTFDGLAGLADALKANAATAPCLVKHLYRYATGSADSQGEPGAVSALASGFAANGYRLRALLGDIVSSEGFRLLTPLQP